MHVQVLRIRYRLQHRARQLDDRLELPVDTVHNGRVVREQDEFDRGHRGVAGRTRHRGDLRALVQLLHRSKIRGADRQSIDGYRARARSAVPSVSVAATAACLPRSDRRLRLERLPSDRSRDQRVHRLPNQPGLLADRHRADLPRRLVHDPVRPAGDRDPGGLRRRESRDTEPLRDQHAGSSAAVLLPDASHRRQQHQRTSGAAAARDALPPLRHLRAGGGLLFVADTVRLRLHVPHAHL